MDLTDKRRMFILPFVYYYTLSISVIVIGVYLLAKLPPTGMSLSFAQTDDTHFVESGAEIQLSAFDQFVPIEVPTTSDKPCDSEKAKQIDAFFKKNNAPLSGFGCDFINHADENKINSYIVAAIGWCESNGGKVTPQFKDSESYNAWGWGVLDSNDNTRELDAYSCDSWEHCIGRVSRGLGKKNYLGTEPVDIVKWYAPASVDKADGDASQAPWVKCVESTIKQMSAL